MYFKFLIHMLFICLCDSSILTQIYAIEQCFTTYGSQLDFELLIILNEPPTNLKLNIIFSF